MFTRIKQVLEYSRLNQQEFAERIAIAPATLSNIIKGKQAKYSTDLVMSITKAYPEIDLLWLLSGQGDMFKVQSPIDDNGNPLPDDFQNVNNTDTTDGQSDYPAYGDDTLFAGLSDDPISGDARIASKSPTPYNGAENQAGRQPSTNYSTTGGRGQGGNLGHRNGDKGAAQPSSVPRGSRSANANGRPQEVFNISNSYNGQNPANYDINQLDKLKRKIKEIRVFFDDGTYEIFVPHDS